MCIYRSFGHFIYIYEICYKTTPYYLDILTVWHSIFVPGRYFFLKIILKKSADDNKSTKNYPACKELAYECVPEYVVDRLQNI